MLFAPIPQNELSRLQALHEINILDTQPDVRFDCVTRFAAEKLCVPICLITLIDANRQWFKSTWGVDISEIPRDLSICAHAICEVPNNHCRERVYEVANLCDDSRFFDNPQVASDPWIRSYISYVFQSTSGMNIGTLCLVDTRPRKFSDQEIDLIIELGAITEDLVNGRGVSPKVIN